MIISNLQELQSLPENAIHSQIEKQTKMSEFKHVIEA